MIHGTRDDRAYPSDILGRIEDPVEIVEKVMAAFNRGRGMEPPPPAERHLFADHLEIVPLRALLEDTLYRGPNALDEFARQSAESWAELHVEARSIRRIRASADVVVNGRLTGTARGTGMPLEVDLTWVVSVRGGRVVRIATHASEREAVRALRRWLLDRARLYFVCEARPHGDDPRPLLDAAIRGGAGIVQLRDKQLADEELVEASRPFREAADAGGVLFILNDRPDLVGATHADGVHVGQDDLPVAEARRIAGADALVGLSTHSESEIEAACAATGDDRPDQLSVGPVWETPTKEGRPATGLRLVEFAARAATILWFAIGGIDTETVAEVAAAGATKAVVVRAIRDADDPEAAARAIGDTLAARGRQTAAQVDG